MSRSATDVRPFRGIRFDWKRVPMGRALCPPYDVIGPELASRLRREPANAIHVELPEGPGLSRYRAAAAALRRWREDGLVVEDREPAFYVVEQSFRARGRSHRRTGFLGALGLASSGKVVPHERTFPKPKEDRLRLLSAIKANTSPIFLMYEDRSGAVRRMLERATAGRPDASGNSPDGTSVRVWRLAEPAACAALSRGLWSKTLLVADGHHRLEVAREFWRGSGKPPQGSVLAYFCAEEDPGLVVFPTHRVVTQPLFAGRMAGELRRLAREKCRAAPCPRGRLSAALARARSPLSFAAWYAGQDGPLLSAVMTPSAASGRVCRSGLAVEWLQDRLLATAPAGAVRYTHGVHEALGLAAETAGLALLVPDLEVADIRRAVRRIGLLPQKTTYFFPKIGAGIAFKPVG